MMMMMKLDERSDFIRLPQANVFVYAVILYNKYRIAAASTSYLSHTFCEQIASHLLIMLIIDKCFKFKFFIFRSPNNRKKIS